jgi:hypothetical protein
MALAGKHAEGAQLGAGLGLDQLGRLVRQVIEGSLPCGVGEARSQATFQGEQPLGAVLTEFCHNFFGTWMVPSQALQPSGGQRLLGEGW